MEKLKKKKFDRILLLFHLLTIKILFSRVFFNRLKKIGRQNWFAFFCGDKK